MDDDESDDEWDDRCEWWTMMNQKMNEMIDVMMDDRCEWWTMMNQMMDEMIGVSDEDDGWDDDWW